MSKDYWESSKEECKSEVVLHFGKCCIPGTFSIEATIPSYPGPIGIVWFRWVGNSTIEIIYSFVISNLRRQKIRTKIHKFLLESYKDNVKKIMTGSATDLAKPWLKKLKFKKQKNGDYVLEVLKLK